ncbi:hypothetical protein V6N11_050937 [Hibiscus sabdariffa]|uniref:Zinc finger, CCHC-type n=1 Tax=Hibiscus sabdariffa TaxID=183260 RepID=A0ABR2R2U5_9ROSI
MAKNTISMRSLLEKEKLNGINFLDWFRNLRIVIKQERKEYVIEEAVPNDPGANALRADKDKFKKHMTTCLTLNLKEIYEGQARQERYETSSGSSCHQDDGWMAKGMPRIETTGPALAEISAETQISAEHLAVLLAYL